MPKQRLIFLVIDSEIELPSKTTEKIFSRLLDCLTFQYWWIWGYPHWHCHHRHSTTTRMTQLAERNHMEKHMNPRLPGTPIDPYNGEAL